jgi:hypothetical protein
MQKYDMMISENITVFNYGEWRIYVIILMGRITTKLENYCSRAMIWTPQRRKNRGMRKHTLEDITEYFILLNFVASSEYRISLNKK